MRVKEKHKHTKNEKERNRNNKREMRTLTTDDRDKATIFSSTLPAWETSEIPRKLLQSDRSDFLWSTLIVASFHSCYALPGMISTVPEDSRAKDVHGSDETLEHDSSE